VSRITPSSSTASDIAWQEDTWYPVTLKGYEIQPKGRVGYKGQPAKHTTLDITWALVEDEDTWIKDWVDLTVTPQRDGTQPKCKLFICTLAGRDPRREATPWVDDESLEFGFDAEGQVVSGRILTGIKLAVKGKLKTDGEGIDRLRVERYSTQQMASPASPQQVAGPVAMLSQDGQWQWDGSQWVPATRPAVVPAPQPVPVPAPVQTDLL